MKINEIFERLFRPGASAARPRLESMAGDVDLQHRPAVAGDGVHDLGWALGTVLRSWMREMSACVADLPGGPRGYQVLSMANGGVCGTQAAMAERLGLDRTVVTHLIDDLEQQGLVERQPDPADRRARRVIPTRAGRAAHARVAEHLAQIERSVLAGLSGDEADRLRDLLYRAASGVADPPRDSCEVANELSG